MPIWSLTQERIDKLNKQIDDQSFEIDKLSKLTIEDLWKIDLDEFINEWRYQLDDEAKRVKKASREGRRESKKLNIKAGGSRKRKDGSEDSDFEAGPKTKKAAVKNEKPVGGILNYLHQPDKVKKPNKPEAPSASQKTAQKLLDSGIFNTTTEAKKSEDPWLSNVQLDGAAASAEATKASTANASSKPSKKAAASKIQELSDSDGADEEAVKPAAAGRRQRAAAAKPKKYNALSDSDSDGDGMLFDVGKLVKGIDTTAASSDNSRPLFSASASRPGSSAGLPRKSTSAREINDIDADDTDYTKLAPPTTSKGSAITARHTVLSDDEENDSMDPFNASPPRKTSKPLKAPKPAPSSKANGKPKAAAAKKPTPAPQAPPKSNVLSPAAKAYAAKKAKAAKAAEKEEDDEMDIVADNYDDDDDDMVLDVQPSKPAAAPARPARRAAATVSKKKWADSDEDEDDFDEDDESESEADFGDEADETFD